MRHNVRQRHHIGQRPFSPLLASEGQGRRERESPFSVGIRDGRVREVDEAWRERAERDRHLYVIDLVVREPIC